MALDISSTNCSNSNDIVNTDKATNLKDELLSLNERETNSAPATTEESDYKPISSEQNGPKSLNGLYLDSVTTPATVPSNQTQFQTPPNFNQHAIDLLLKRTGYPMLQENGQRKYGPAPDWDAATPEPDRSCEVFVGKIPRDCFEDEIIPMLESIGRIYEFRLMMEYSGYNRGYGFVMYTTREDAKKAVLDLNNFEIRKVLKCLSILQNYLSFFELLI